MKLDNIAHARFTEVHRQTALFEEINTIHILVVNYIYVQCRQEYQSQSCDPAREVHGRNPAGLQTEQYKLTFMWNVDFDILFLKNDQDVI